MKTYKYFYDIKTGHYVKKSINEDDNTAQQNNVTTDTEQQTSVNTSSSNNTQKVTSRKSIDSNENIKKLVLETQQVDKKYQDDIMQQNKLLELAKIKATEKNYMGPYDPVDVDSDVLNILKRINLINKNYHMKKYDIEERRLAILAKLSQETNEQFISNLPDKYKKYLTESNINSAKVYMKGLVGSDNNQILKNMHDFKKVFKKTNLLYGKDNTDYFIIAIDSDDLNTLSDTLEEQGYLRDEILDTIMPQILDRTAMIQ